MNYIIADSSKRRCGLLQKRINRYRSVNCAGAYLKEVELLERVWIDKPELVLIYVGDQQINAFSALRRVKEITPEVKVAFYSECSEYALEAYEKGADYFLPLPADDIQIGRLVFRFLEPDRMEARKY
jgi:two-component SAPR family response regulator